MSTCFFFCCRTDWNDSNVTTMALSTLENMVSKTVWPNSNRPHEDSQSGKSDTNQCYSSLPDDNYYNPGENADLSNDPKYMAIDYNHQKPAHKMDPENRSLHSPYRNDNHHRSQYDDPHAYTDENRQDAYKGEHQQDAHKDEHRRDAYKDERRQDSYKDEQRRDTYKNERRRDSYKGERRRGSYKGERRRDSFKGERWQDAYKDEHWRDAYKGEHLQDSYKDEHQWYADNDELRQVGYLNEHPRDTYKNEHQHDVYNDEHQWDYETAIHSSHRIDSNHRQYHQMSPSFEEGFHNCEDYYQSSSPRSHTRLCDSQEFDLMEREYLGRRNKFPCDTDSRFNQMPDKNQDDGFYPDRSNSNGIDDRQDNFSQFDDGRHFSSGVFHYSLPDDIDSESFDPDKPIGWRYYSLGLKNFKWA